MKCIIRYKRGTQVETLAFAGTEERKLFSMDAPALTAALAKDEDNVIRLMLTPHEPVELQSVTVVLPFKFQRTDALFLNGYQS